MANRLLAVCALALCVSLAAAEVYFEEKFNDGELRCQQAHPSSGLSFGNFLRLAACGGSQRCAGQAAAHAVLLPASIPPGCLGHGLASRGRNEGNRGIRPLSKLFSVAGPAAVISSYFL